MALAFITNINPTELMLIAIVAILIFGRRLPEVAGQAAGHVQRARRALNDLKRESGIEDEMREVRRAMDTTANPQPKPAPGAQLPSIERPSRTVGRHETPPSPLIEADPIADSGTEPKAEAERKPDAATSTDGPGEPDGPSEA